MRQEKYLRALKTTPIVSITEGKFITEKIAWAKADGTGTVEVIRNKEKRSDVNLACVMLMDGVRQRYDTAVLISADSDFMTPVSFVRDLGKEVWILDPSGATKNSPLNKLADHYRPIRDGALIGAQFDIMLEDVAGPFSKPGEWFSKSNKISAMTD